MTPTTILLRFFCCHFGCGSPPLVRISTTSDPESEDVAKNSTTTTIASTEASTDRNCGTGSPSISTKIEVSASAVASGCAGSASSDTRALSPKIVSQTMDAPPGANRAPATNWRMVRP